MLAKKARIDVETLLDDLSNTFDTLNWKKTVGDGLNVDYVKILPNSVATLLLQELEDTVEYYDDELSKVKVFGKWHQIPRKQSAYGEESVKYRFSGTTVPAKPWTSALRAVKEMLKKATSHDYNFVLINKYRNGNDHIGEHRDAEPEIDPNVPIASISLGQQRQFVLKHGDSRKKGAARQNIAPVKIDLEHGSLLLMNPPTNQFWYHSLPARKAASGVRINLTFRQIVPK